MKEIILMVKPDLSFVVEMMSDVLAPAWQFILDHPAVIMLTFFTAVLWIGRLSILRESRGE
jgi:hypothetical protein